MGILLVYDVTDEASFNNIRNWMRNIEQHASDNVNKASCGVCHSVPGSSVTLVKHIANSRHAEPLLAQSAYHTAAEEHALGACC